MTKGKFPLVFDRMFKPEAGTLLYHYCSTPTLLSVMETNSLRFSDLNMMNDAGEYRYGYSLFERAANALLKSIPEQPALEGLDTNFFDFVDAYLSPKQFFSHPVISCFSKNPDVLSQWRGYAQDGQGWAIGFDAEAISQMPISLIEVAYDQDQQLDEVRNFLAAMYVAWRQDGGDLKTAVGKDAALLSSLIVAYKHPSFREEQEVRALHELTVEVNPSGAQLIDPGGTANGIPVNGQQVRYRASGSSVVAYVDLPLPQQNDGAIRALWFGPRNDNGPGNAIYPLTQFGHTNVELHWSSSSYRG